MVCVAFLSFLVVVLVFDDGVNLFPGNVVGEVVVLCLRGGGECLLDMLGGGGARLWEGHKYLCWKCPHYQLYTKQWPSTNGEVGFRTRWTRDTHIVGHRMWSLWNTNSMIALWRNMSGNTLLTLCGNFISNVLSQGLGGLTLCFNVSLISLPQPPSRNTTIDHGSFFIWFNLGLSGNRGMT